MRRNQSQVLKAIFFKALNPLNLDKTNQLLNYMSTRKGINWKKYITNINTYNLALNSNIVEYSLKGKGETINKIWYYNLDNSSIEKIKRSF